jgi:hypothetical protein
LVLLDGCYESIEKVVAVVRPSCGLGVVLHRERGQVKALQALDNAVI